MAIETKVRLRRMTVPNYVLAESRIAPRNEGFTESPKFALRELPAETLSALCDQFRADVFRRAGKVDPRDHLAETEARDG